MGKSSQNFDKRSAAEKARLRRPKFERPTTGDSSKPTDSEEEKPWYKRTAVILALIPATVALLVGAFPYVSRLVSVTKAPTTTPKTFSGKVVNEQTKKGIHGAKVSLEAKGIPSILYTDSEGVFLFPVDSTMRETKILVEANGFLPFERRVDVSAKNEPEDIRLTPKEVSSQPASSGPPSPVRTPSGQRTKPSRKSSARDSNAREREAIKVLTSPSSTPNP